MLVIGAGVIGLSIGIALLESNPSLKVIILEKESGLAKHASGRNSGVLHAGFYYSPDSLKARFCRDGNRELRALIRQNGLLLREVGKVVVAQSESEVQRLSELAARGISNGVEIELLDASKLKNYEPLAITNSKFLWSPTTSVADPQAISSALANNFLKKGGQIHFEDLCEIKDLNGEIVEIANGYQARHIVNAAGSQADRIARGVNVGTEFAMLPFMGLYRATSEKNLPLQRLVYPVPHLINPFLGVHFTLTIDHKVKIGPTAIPILGREQYSLLQGWSSADIQDAIRSVIALIRGNSHNFGSMVKSEWPKIFQQTLVKESLNLVPSVKNVSSWQRKPPGIRAQLVHLPTGRLEQDFVVRQHKNATHVLNAVSPGWTSAIPFGRWVAEKVINNL